jgi:hypothetical protein
MEAAQVSPRSRDADAPKPVARRPTARLSGRERVARSLGPLRPRPATLVLLALATGAAALTWADPFAEPEDTVLLTNTRSGGRRVFPTLVDADPSKATIELQAPGEPLVRIVPAPDGGHRLMREDVLLGPVAAEDFDGLWSSLRLATATRKTGGRKGLGIGQRGVIRISLPDSNLTLSLGDTTTGGGVYAAFEADGDAWVVEAELLSLVEQPAVTWLSPRLVPVDPDLVTSLAWGDELVLNRANDGFWRVRAGAEPALLSTDAVNFRLRRLLRAKLDPVIERDAVGSESLRPWLVVTTVDGGSRALLVGDECPGHPDRRLVDRGPGLIGCVPAVLFERWPLHDPDAAMIEARLVPHDYGRIVRLGLELGPELGGGAPAPAARGLIRRGGEWFYEADDTGLVPVAEEEVRRWYRALGRLEVALADADAGEAGEVGVGFEPDWVLQVRADTDDLLRVACRLADAPVRCVRDDGPVLRVLGEVPRNLEFEAETFADRRLTNIGVGEIRSLEILPPPVGESTTVRQSVHADLGVWELDAPVHVDDSGAVDQVRLETVLWALRQVRAEAWVDDPSSPPLRLLSVEVVPAIGPRRNVTVALYDDCIVEVEGHPFAAIARAQCEALAGDLFFDDPLRFWLERSRGLEIADAEGERVFLNRRDQQFVTADERAIEPELARRLGEWIEWRSAGLRAGEAPGPVAWTLDIRREFGPPAVVEIGEGWARLKGADWYYEQRAADASTAPPDGLDTDLDEFDAGAVVLD